MSDFQIGLIVLAAAMVVGVILAVIAIKSKRQQLNLFFFYVPFGGIEDDQRFSNYGNSILPGTDMDSH